MLPRFRDQRRITSMTDHYAGVGAAGCPSRGHDVLGVEDLVRQYARRPTTTNTRIVSQRTLGQGSASARRDGSQPVFTHLARVIEEADS